MSETPALAGNWLGEIYPGVSSRQAMTPTAENWKTMKVPANLRSGKIPSLTQMWDSVCPWTCKQDSSARKWSLVYTAYCIQGGPKHTVLCPTHLCSKTYTKPRCSLVRLKNILLWLLSRPQCPVILRMSSGGDSGAAVSVYFWAWSVSPGMGGWGVERAYSGPPYCCGVDKPPMYHVRPLFHLIQCPISSCS